VHRIIGGVEVEHQFGGRFLERGDEALDDHFMQRPRRCPRGAVFEPAQCGGRSQRRIAFDCRLQQRVAA
jgi:hypothetical protein